MKLLSSLSSLSSPTLPCSSDYRSLIDIRVLDCLFCLLSATANNCTDCIDEPSPVLESTDAVALELNDQKSEPANEVAKTENNDSKSGKVLNTG